MKTYLRYVHEEAFGLVCTPRAPVIADGAGKLAFAAGVHEVLVWDLKLGEQVRYMTPDGEGRLKGEVTSLTLVGGNVLAVGYSTGVVRCFDAARGGHPTVSLQGHKGQVSCLAADSRGMVLVSGGHDTDLVVWDLVAERGLARLKGHRDAVTMVRFVAPQHTRTASAGGATTTALTTTPGGGALAPQLTKLVASASKDALVKVWDLVTNSCVQTIVGHRAEVWALACSPDGSRLVSGTNDERLRVWAVRDHDKSDSPDNDDSTGAPPTSANEQSGQEVAAATATAAPLSRSGSVLPCRFMGHVSRTTSSGRCEALQFHNARTPGAASAAAATTTTATTTLLGVQSGGRLVDVYRVRPESEAKKKLKRRLKRHREKAAAWHADTAEGKTTEEQRAEWAELEAEAEADGGHASSLPVASDELELTGTLRASEKVVSFAFLAQPKDQPHRRSVTAAAGSSSSSADAVEWLTAKLLLSLATNALEVHQVSVLALSSASASTPAASAAAAAAAAPPPPQKLLRLDLPGHRSDPKAIAFSGDASLLASVAAGSLKVWSPETRQCLRSLDDLGQSPRFKALGWEAPHDTSSMVGPTAKNPNASGGGGSGSSVGAAAAATAVCVLWLTGDQWLVVGTREGSLLLCDLASGSVAVRLDGAHKGTVASLALAPEGSSVASGGADGEVKFWDVEEVDEGEEVEDLDGMSDDDDDDDSEKGGKQGDPAVAASDTASNRRKRMELVHAKTLKMGDDVTCVAFSKGRDPKKQLVCVATLDATVRVYFKDSLKFFLQLYGHKLPVTCMDVADDNTVLATGSHDKTIKLWGLDFGDCRRSLLAHNDSVTSLQFVPRTHYIFSASKDRNLKYWDADHFEQVLLLDGHASEVWGLSVSRDGSSVATCGRDRSLRLWGRTDEPVFLEEEREKELEAAKGGSSGSVGAADLGRQYEQNSGFGGAAAAAPPMGGDDDDFNDFEGADGEGGGAGGGMADRATKGTIESVIGGERLMDALEIADAEEAAMGAWDKAALAAAATGMPPPKPRQPNPLLLDLDPDRYLLTVLRRVKRPDLEEALLVLPFHLVEALVRRLANLLDQPGLDHELVARSAVFLVRLHHSALAASGRCAPLLRRLRDLARTSATALRDEMGTNLAGLKLLKRSLADDHHTVELEPVTAADAKQQQLSKQPNKAAAKQAKKKLKAEAVANAGGNGMSAGASQKKKKNKGSKV